MPRSIFMKRQQQNYNVYKIRPWEKGKQRVFPQAEEAVGFPLRTKLGRILITVLFVGVLVFFGIYSAVDVDKTVSETENRALASMPKFSVESFLSRKFTADFDEYYADTFPFRDFFLGVHEKVSSVLTKNSGKDDMVLVDGPGEDDFGGQDIDYEE